MITVLDLQYFYFNFSMFSSFFNFILSFELTKKGILKWETCKAGKPILHYNFKGRKSEKAGLIKKIEAVSALSTHLFEDRKEAFTSEWHPQFYFTGSTLIGQTTIALNQ